MERIQNFLNMRMKIMCYVRAIPKYSVARTDKKVTTITKAGDGETSEEDSFLDDDQSLDDYFRT